MFKNLCDTCHLLVYCLNYCWSWRISTGGLKEMHERDNLPCNVSVYILRQWPDESFKYQQNSIGQDILFCDTFSSWTQTYHCSLCAVEFFFNVKHVICFRRVTWSSVLFLLLFALLRHRPPSQYRFSSQRLQHSIVFWHLFGHSSTLACLLAAFNPLFFRV